MKQSEFYAELNRLLPENREYLRWYEEGMEVTVDGSFTASELRTIADLLDRAVSVGTDST